MRLDYNLKLQALEPYKMKVPYPYMGVQMRDAGLPSVDERKEIYLTAVHSRGFACTQTRKNENILLILTKKGV